MTAAPAGATRGAEPAPRRTGPLAGPLARVDWALAGVLALALGARLWGIAWGLPYLLHPDESYPLRAIQFLRSGDWNPHAFSNPTLLPELLAAEYWLAGLLVGPAALLDGPDLSTAFLLARITSALLGAATAWAVYDIGRTLLDRRVALLGAACLALDFLHARDSHYATNDIAATALLALSAVTAARIARRPAAWPYLLAGLLGGLATGAKYSSGLFVAPLVAAHLLAWGRPGRALAPRALALLALAGLAALLGSLAATPFALLDWTTFSGDFNEQYADAAVGWFGQSADPVPLLYLLTLGRAMGWAQCALAVVGLLALVMRERRAALVIAPLPLIYLAFMASKQLFFVRFAIPALPFLALLAAAGAVALADRIPAPRLRPPALGLLALLAVVPPTLLIVQHNLLITRDDTRVLATRWALEHLEPGARVATDKAGLVPPGEGWTDPRLEVTDMDRVFRDSVKETQQRGFRYLVASSFVDDRYWLPSTALWAEHFKDARRLKWPDEAERAAAFLEQRAPIHTFAPGAGGASLPFQLDDLYTPFWTLDGRERPGPTVRIYGL